MKNLNVNMNMCDVTSSVGVTGVEAEVFSCLVKSVKSLSSNTYQIELEAPEGVELNYLAGHYLQLVLDVNEDGNPLSLSYSIANNRIPEQPRRLLLFIQHTSDFVGKVLKRLSAHLENNESVDVKLPMGQSYLQTDLSLPHLLIAAGSGIAKIKCLTEAILSQQPDAKITVYWSNRDRDEFYLLDRFKELESQHSNLRFIPILEAAHENWSGRSGYIYEVIEEDFDNLEGIQTYLCGSPRMVYGTIDKLKGRGLTIEQCRSDAFEVHAANI